MDNNDEIMLAEMTPKRRAGRRVFKETRHPVYRGIRRRNGDKWVCEVREPIHQRRIWLGTYPTADMAARAHDVAVLALRGRSACLNFADSAWRLPAPESTDPDVIRRVAAEAAEMFRPTEYDSGITVLPSYGDEVDMGFGSGSGSEERNLYGYVEQGEEEVSTTMMRLATEPLMSPPRSYMEGMTSNTYMEEEMSYQDMSLWSYNY
ncbi:Dehydration-responsive element-binding protein 1F [Raphanus sativus]|uniref:Dehydration-responsive element-binding protein 1F-like n=1 Tax=Raphanus sativus TaxID=3726 RepID=A0A9W3DGT2_RAPSA|nr:dehydration-responsive element-binding protein 1F-like [Raphanus sativus]KAJ4915581.1 Dehydration-responsive element-binding protein 1F [Raphanus sativus]